MSVVVVSGIFLCKRILSSHLLHSIIAIWAIFLAPLDIIRLFRCRIFFDETANYLLGIRKLVKIVLKYFSLFELLHEGASLGQLLILIKELLEQATDARMIRKHHSRHLVRRLDVRTALRQGHLDAGRAPWDEVGQLSLSDSLQRLMHLRWIDFALNDVEYRYVSTFFNGSRHQDVLSLQQSSHDIQHSCFSDVLLLCLVKDQRRVASHQKVTPRSRN